MDMQGVPLIPRRVFFGNPDRASVQLSPDGNRISYLAPLDGVLNLWVAPRGDVGAARAVTHDTGRGIRLYLWAFTSDRLLYLQDQDGDENWRLYDVALADGTVRNLTPFDGVQARIQGANADHPHEVLVALNRRDPAFHDLYRLDLRSGELTLVAESEGFMEFLTDGAYRVRGAVRQTPDGGLEILKPTMGGAIQPSLRVPQVIESREEPSAPLTDAEALVHSAAKGPAPSEAELPAGGWEVWQRISPEDAMTTSPAGFTRSGNTLYMIDSRGRDTAALVAVDMASDESNVIAASPQADVQQVLVHPRERVVQAAAFVYERKEWEVLDTAILDDLVYLGKLADGEVEVASRTLDDGYWIVAYVVDDGALRYYLYDHKARKATFLFTNRADLEGLQLAKMRSHVIQARDGQDLVAYLTLPQNASAGDGGKPETPLPMVFVPHGGPWGRDTWGFNGLHQWLANRGYAALSVNFRASTGFGKAFINAGNREWGGTVIEDQQDAVKWAIDQGIADPARVGVLGGSFGGYSTLAGLTFTPELFACGVDLFGPANLMTLLETVPPYWKPMFEMLATRVGDPRTEEGQALLRAHSPLTYADRIVRPLLIGQGANDARVKQAESDQIVQAMKEKDIPVTYVLYPDEGHGFARPENNLSFFAIAEAFLAAHLGGRCQPIGADFEGASLEVTEGAAEVPGLAEAL